MIWIGGRSRIAARNVALRDVPRAAWIAFASASPEFLRGRDLATIVGLEMTKILEVLSWEMALEKDDPEIP